MKNLLKNNFIIIKNEDMDIFYYVFNKDVEYYLNMFGEHFILFFYEDFDLIYIKHIFNEKKVNIGSEIFIYDNIMDKKIKFCLEVSVTCLM